jgi:ubiquinone/menaquinone biosynthesis C-methylase UbiE
MDQPFPPYDRSPEMILEKDGVQLPSFIREVPSHDRNLLKDFEREWKRFNSFGEEELDLLAKELFDVLPPEFLQKGITVADIGCGSGRWSRWLAPKVRNIIAFDPSDAVVYAAEANKARRNIHWCKARGEDVPLRSNSIDLILCIGVLHHLEEPERALKEAFRVLRHGGVLYFYIYYALEQRGPVFKALYRVTDQLRRWIHPLPYPIKYMKSQAIAAMIYWPMARLAGLVRTLGIASWKQLPLAFYHNKSFRIMRNDALDRFGTSVEERFTREEIVAMLERSGFSGIEFSRNAPYWHGVARKV